MWVLFSLTSAMGFFPFMQGLPVLWASLLQKIPLIMCGGFSLTSAMGFFPFMQGIHWNFHLHGLPKEGKSRSNGVKDAPS